MTSSAHTGGHANAWRGAVGGKAGGKRSSRLDATSGKADGKRSSRLDGAAGGKASGKRSPSLGAAGGKPGGKRSSRIGDSACEKAPSRARNDIAYHERPDDGKGGKVVPLRLQKFLARAGVASRRASENLMTQGRVTVNGEVVRELGSKVDPLVDEVAVDGRIVTLADAPVTIMLNKPAGVITTMKAQSDKPIVADFVPTDQFPGLYPIGRLDVDTTGLLLFSTDGEMGHALLHPSHHVPKTYRAQVKGKLTDAQAQRLRDGIELDDGPTQPAEVVFVAGRRDCIDITIHEGRYHQVKRMFEAVGHPVRHLHRSCFGPVLLGDLPTGKWRPLTDAELRSLQGAERP